MAARINRDVRYRQLFPDADTLTFIPARGGFVPLPIVLRKLLHVLSPPQLRVLIYLMTRCSRHGIAYPTTDEIARDLGLRNKRLIEQCIIALQNCHFVSIREADGRRVFLLHDPAVAATRLARDGRISARDLAEIEGLLADLGLPLLTEQLESGSGSTAATEDRP